MGPGKAALNRPEYHMVGDPVEGVTNVEGEVP